MNPFLLLLALLGHGLFAAAAANRIHAVALPRWIIKSTTLGVLFWTIAAPILAAWLLAPCRWSLFDWLRVADRSAASAVLVYLVPCWTFAACMLGLWTVRAIWRGPSHVVRWQRARPAELAAEEVDHHYLVRLPGNEILRLDLSERALDVPRLPTALAGLTIVHFSDLHFTGRIDKAYFREVVRISNEVRPDLVAITGDLVDKVQYVDWLPDTLGELTSRYGVYFVLGNHDVRGADRIREVLCRCGLVDLGGRWVKIDVNGESIVLAGNEIPWFVPAADMAGCPPRAASGGPLRIGLAHSPDQFAWAVAHDFDLLLTGHTHGGQICFPLIGALLTPSWTGVKYAAGVFYNPPTIMHVTRGVSGEFPVRLNCPPEIVKLVLNAAPAGNGYEISEASRPHLGGAAEV